MVGAVSTRGLAETIRAFNRLNLSVARDLGNELKKAAEPVRDAAEQKISRYAGVGPVGIRRRGADVSVEQRARRVTGQRPDFGSLQMTKGFIPALEENRDEVISGVEDALDRWTGASGF